MNLTAGALRMPAKAKGNYGVDSPAIVATLCALGLVGLGLGYVSASGWRWIARGVGGYFLLGAAGMLFYSKVGKLGLRERLLDKIPWLGDERVLDVGCGRGLLTVGAAHRLSSGRVVGVDIWQPGAISGNRADSVLENARIEGVNGRVEVKEGDARKLPFSDQTFDVVVSNFVVHDVKARSDRETMMREIARVLKPGGRVALVDFIFTDDCVEDLRKAGVETERARDGFLSFWISAVLNFGAVKTYHVFGRKM
jgi:arsenite methyltransferase